MIGLFRAIDSLELLYLISRYLLKDPYRSYVILMLVSYTALLIMMSVIDHRSSKVCVTTKRGAYIFFLKVGIPTILAGIGLFFFIL